MKKFGLFVVNTLLVIVALAFMSENYLAYKGYDFSYLEHLRSLQRRVPRELLGVRRQTGWGFEEGYHVSREDSRVIEDIGDDGLRVSRPKEKKNYHKKIAILGCSWTLGVGVDSPATYVYRLNQMLPDTLCDNYGVNGYGTYQCLLTEEHLLKNNDYDLFAYAATSPHLKRNLERDIMGQIRKNEPFVVRPRVELGREGISAYYPADSLRWPYENKFVTVDFAKRLYYSFVIKEQPPVTDNNSTEAKEYVERCNRALLLLTAQMAQEAKAAHKQFVVFALDGVVEQIFQENRSLVNYPVVYAGKFDNNDPANHVCNKLYAHPNGKVHAYWAKEIAQYLKKQGYK